MTILLIEDEPLIARQLQKVVHQLEPGAVVHGPLASVQEIGDYFTAQQVSDQPYPDLVIADIQLSDGVSIEAFGQIELRAPVIFTTAYDEYAIRAFKLNSIDYLLKPIDPDDLQAALTKYHRWQPGRANVADQFRAFLNQFQQPDRPAYKRRFMAHHGRQIVPVPQEQVACFVRDELIYLYTLDGQKVVTDYRTLDELGELVDPALFFRANRQFLVGLEAVGGYRTHHSGRIDLVLKKPNDALVLSVSKEKAALFRQWFEG